jgi:hypothetical protein
MKKPPLLTIGWREWIDFPDLNIFRIKAKIDTGARSSSLHAFHLHPFQREGKEFIRFQVHPYQRNSRIAVQAEAELLDWRYVTSSGGHRQFRPVISTPIVLDGQTWFIELTLTNRDVMGFRLLLGREALRKRFLVNPARSFLLSKKA